MINKKKVIICALGDYYWADYADKLSSKLSKEGYEPIIVSESRQGEYQCNYARNEYTGFTSYYLTDFISSHKMSKSVAIDKKIVFSDFIRLRTLGGRGLVSQKNWMDAARQLTDFIDFVFEQEKDIFAVLHETVSTSISYALYNKSKSYGIPFMGFVNSKISNRIECDLPFDKGSELIKREYDRLIVNQSMVSAIDLEWAKGYINNITEYTPDYMQKNILNSSSFKVVFNKKNLKSFFGSVMYFFKEKVDRKKLILREGPIKAKFRSLYRNFIRRCRMKFLSYNFDRLDNEWLRKSTFYIFPIHFQPEASTSVGSPFFENQLELVRNIAFSLGENEFLIVKEHVSNYGYFNSSVYDEIKSLPGVKLIGPKHNIKDFIKLSQGVIALTSTVGFEALLLDKPVLVFGDVFYNKHPLCRKINSIFEIKKAFSELNERVILGNYNNQLFLLAYKSFTVSGRVIYGEDCLNICNSSLEYLSNLNNGN
jgi:hypothetical protein